VGEAVTLCETDASREGLVITFCLSRSSMGTDSKETQAQGQMKSRSYA